MTDALRDQVGALLVALRGETSQSELARQLGITRQTLRQMEAGGVSFSKLDDLGPVLGVRFVLVALDEVTGEVRAPEALAAR